MEIPMILETGTHLTAELDDGTFIQAAVIGAGPADSPETVWAITKAAPRQYALIRKAIPGPGYRAKLLPPDAPSPYIGDDRVHPPHAGHPGDPAYDASL